MRARTQRLKFSVQIIRVVEKRWKDVTAREREVEWGIKGEREKWETRRAVLLSIGDVESRSPPGTVERGPKASSRRVTTVIFPYESVRTRPRSSAAHHAFRVNISRLNDIYRWSSIKLETSILGNTVKKYLSEEIGKQLEGERDRRRERDTGSEVRFTRVLSSIILSLGTRSTLCVRRSWTRPTRVSRITAAGETKRIRTSQRVK